MTREEAEKELIAMLEEAEGGPSYSMEEVDAYMRELLHPKNQIYLTGDTHGQFERIISFCERQQVQPESTFIILGDVGLNYYGDRRDNRGKDNLTKIPITFFCIHGNHEMRPSKELGYQVKEYHGGKVWVQPEYPNLVFAIDGEIYDFFGHSCIVIGGAYSVDKYYRLARGYNWFEDEQPSDEIKEKVERVLSERDWKIDSLRTERKKGIRPMLPKGLFLSTLEKIQKQEARIDEFNTALSKICDGVPVFDSENQYLIALRELLKYTMQDQYDYIGWWLYEAPDAGYTVWWDDEDGKEIRVDLTEPGALYDYLVEYAAPEGVQEDEL